MHHFPAKEDLVLAALEHLLTRRIREFEETFAQLPADQRSPAAAMRLLYEHCFRDTFAAWLELVVASRTDPALHERFGFRRVGCLAIAGRPAFGRGVVCDKVRVEAVLRQESDSLRRGQVH